MNKKYSRKDFLKLSTAAGAGFLLAACGTTGSEAIKDTLASTNDSSKKNNTVPANKTGLVLIGKEDARYEALRKGFNKRISKMPLLIALCTSTQDVADAILYARKNNLPVAIKSGGHSMEGFSSNDGGLVINLSEMNSVQLQADHTVKAGPGCKLMQLYDEILPQKRILPAGSCGTVGLGGLTMGGGYGLFSRKYGLTCDHLLEATVVDGNGNIHSTKDDPELLWALRGGNAGNFAVATELIYQTHPAPSGFQAHHFKARKLDAERAADLLEKWFDFAAQLPDSCFSGFVLNGSTLNVLVTNCEQKNQGSLQLLLEEFQHYTDEFHSGEVRELAPSLKNYYGSLVPVYFKNASAGLYKSFEDIRGCIHEVLEKSIHTPGMIYQVNTLGGKIADPEFEKVSAYPHRAFSFLSELQAYWQQPSQEEKLTTVFGEIQELFGAQGIKAQYVNYCSLDFDDWQSAYYGENYSRLQAVKRKYDPDNTIRHPQSVQA